MSEQPQQAEKRNPNVWVPMLYYTQGFPFSFVTEMAQVLFKMLGVANEALGIFSGVFALPWAFKFLWSPLVELFGTKRRWILAMQGLLVVSFIAVAAVIFLPKSAAVFSLGFVIPNPKSAWTPVLILLLLFSVAFALDARRPAAVRGAFTLAGIAGLALSAIYRSVLYASTTITLTTYIWFVFGILLVAAFLSATHDIAIDGYYLDMLDKKAQATYSGIRVAAYRVAMVVAGGLLVMLAGGLGGNNPVAIQKILSGWGVAIATGAALFALFFVFNMIYLPKSTAVSLAKDAAAEKKSYVEAITTYLDQKRIIFILAFIVLFRIGDFLWKPMSKPFLLDIGVTQVQIGFLQGVVGIIATILGSIAGGIYISKRGLTRGLWVLGIIQSLTLLLYAYLAVMHPILPKGGAITSAGFIHVGVINAFENFAYGLGTIAFVNFLMRTCKKEYTAAHYAIATGLMALATAIAGTFSGFIQHEIGYLYFFILCFACSIPGLFVLAFLPLKDMEQAKG